jgi:hypothetical protein
MITCMLLHSTRRLSNDQRSQVRVPLHVLERDARGMPTARQCEVFLRHHGRQPNSGPPRVGHLPSAATVPGERKLN